MPRLRPRYGSRSAIRGGGGERAGRGGPALLHAVLPAGRYYWSVPACVPPSGRKNLANRAENVSLLGVYATSACLVDADAVLPDPLGSCHEASVDDDSASSSRSVRPFGWLWRHEGSYSLAVAGGVATPVAVALPRDRSNRDLATGAPPRWRSTCLHRPESETRRRVRSRTPRVSRRCR